MKRECCGVPCRPPATICRVTTTGESKTVPRPGRGVNVSPGKEVNSDEPTKLNPAASCGGCSKTKMGRRRPGSTSGWVARGRETVYGAACRASARGIRCRVGATTSMPIRSILAGSIIAACLSGCGTETSLESPDSAARIRALRLAAVNDDRDAIPQMIELLQSDDPAVRLFTIGTLEKMTGQTLGYDYAASEGSRRAAVDRWRQWLTAQQSPATGGTEPAQTGGFSRSRPIDQPNGEEAVPKQGSHASNVDGSGLAVGAEQLDARIALNEWTPERSQRRGGAFSFGGSSRQP